MVVLDSVQGSSQLWAWQYQPQTEYVEAIEQLAGVEVTITLNIDYQSAITPI